MKIAYEPFTEPSNAFRRNELIVNIKECKTAIYIAGSSKEWQRAEQWMIQCRAMGFIVTSTWIDEIRKVAAERTAGDFAKAANPVVATQADRLQWSNGNIAAIDRASHLWLLVPERATPSQGAFFEFGYALASGRTTCASGGDQSAIFTACANWLCDTDDQAYGYLIRQYMNDAAAKEAGWSGNEAEIPPWLMRRA